MKTSFNIKTLVLVIFASLSLSVFAQPMSINGKKGNDTNGDNLMPMTINGPKAKSSADNNTGGDNLMPMSINSPKKPIPCLDLYRQAINRLRLPCRWVKTPFSFRVLRQNILPKLPRTSNFTP